MNAAKRGARAATAVRHVVCFEESGDCTLERVVREARVGDSVVVLGPQSYVEALRALGLAREIPIGRFARVGNEWRLALPPGGAEPIGRTLCHGPQAKRLSDRTALRAPIGEDLPPRPHWPEGRRERIRRELGITAREIAVLVGCERAETVDLSFIARGVGMAVVGGAPIRLVVSPETPRWTEVDAFLRAAAGAKGVVVDARAERPWELLPALDGCILDRDGALERPDVCAGWRPPERLPRTVSDAGDAVSPLPALWALACGVRAIVHASIDLGPRGAHPRLKRFDRDVAELARGLVV